MYDHKQEIINTRVGCLGGSDAKMLLGIANLGSVPASAVKRLAVCKGLTPQPTFTNQAMEFGNYIEDYVFNMLHTNDARWQSNPCLTSEKYSRRNVKCIDHVDFFLQDDEKKEILIGECKATRYSYMQTRNEYDAQLQHHYLLGSELAKKLGGYKVKVVLAHYCTDGIDLDAPFEFDEQRLTVKPVRLSKSSYDLSKAMDIVDQYLEGLTEYYEESVDGEFLPTKVKEEFDAVTNMLAEIKAREAKVDDFKKRLTAFMGEKGVKKISTDSWSITYVAPSEAVSFDSKAFLQDYSTEHPHKYRKLVKTYEKRQKRAASVRINIKDNSNE